MLRKIVLSIYLSVFHVADLLFPPLASRWAVRLFCTPGRPRRKGKREFPVQPEAVWTFVFDSDFRMEGIPARYICYEWGRRPLVLLLHGWAGEAMQMGHFVRPLLDAGFGVIAIDAPAHGAAPGKRTNLPEMAQAIADIERRKGSFAAIIAHSFGGVVTAWALRQGVRAKRLITIGSPGSMDYFFDDFKRKLRASNSLMTRFGASIERLAGQPLAEMSLNHMMSELSIPGLVVHDRNDKEVDYRQAQGLHANWKNSELIMTENLGHRRILKDDQIVRQVVHFVNSARKVPASMPVGTV